MIQLQIGRCGNRIGCKFWDAIAAEHGLDGATPSGRVDVFFEERGVEKGEEERRFLPRAVLVDLDGPDLERTIDRAGGRSWFERERRALGDKPGGASNNWAIGFYAEGVELATRSLEIVRREAETCELLRGVQLIHSLGGGTGSGTGALLAERLREEYRGRPVSSYVVMPSGERAGPVEPYNCLLSLGRLIDAEDATFCADNEALRRVCARTLGLGRASYAEANGIVAGCVSAATAGQRSSASGLSLRKILVNLVPYPRLHLLAPGHARSPRRDAVEELGRRAVEPSAALLTCEAASRGDAAVAALLVIRGPTSLTTETTRRIGARAARALNPWTPDAVKAIVVRDPRPLPGTNLSATSITNTSAMRVPLSRLADRCDAMLERKAYLHWYTGQGMDECEFAEARSNVRDLASEYRACRRELPG